MLDGLYAPDGEGEGRGRNKRGAVYVSAHTIRIERATKRIEERDRVDGQHGGRYR